MGFFAKTCAKCKKSVVSRYKVEDHRALPWEAQAMAYLPNGEREVVGLYDGYGRINGTDLMEHWDDLKMIHSQCHAEGDHYDNLPESGDCPSQGFFDWED